MRLPRFKINLSYPLTTLGALLFFILSGIALTHLYNYFRLEARVEAAIDEWKVIKKSSSSYPIRAKYHFEFQGKSYHGSCLKPPPYHLNELSAEKELESLNKQTWSVWIDPRQPTVSSFEKAVPIKKIVYAFFTLGITLYFWFVETNSKIRSPIN
jgi:hypothetical protein